MKKRERQAGRTLRTKAAAEYVGEVSEWTIRHLIAIGELPVVRLVPGGPFLIDVRDLDALIERSKTSKETGGEPQ